jgi:AhpD family alkylhydroperoxidase
MQLPVYRNRIRLSLLPVCMCSVLRLAAADTPSLAPLAALEQQAHRRASGTEARVPLAPPSAEIFRGIDSLEAAGSGQVPNYVRAIGLLPKMAAPFSHLFKTFISNSALPSETKLGMALRIAQINESPYTVAHIERLLRATERGQAILSALRTGQTASLAVPEQQALAYAAALTRNVAGLSDTEFQGARAVYNDSQIVELSFTVCFFNYFTRFTEALNLPVEPWVYQTAPVALQPAPAAPARVSLVSDDEIRAVDTVIAASKAANSPSASWGIGIANSQRAMLNAPDMMLAWRAFGAAAQEYTSVSREIKLDVSFAVSTANGCRYCTLHQVLGLRRLGVDPAKLMAMHKDDSALRPEELAAVTYARKLTAAPAGTSDADFEAVRHVFKEQGAVEVLMQTCNFAFMNRFTDGLRLPSEDEAVKVYQETYGRAWERKK